MELQGVEDIFNETKPITEDKLVELARLSKEAKEVKQRIEHDERELKLAKEYLEKILRVYIPAMFNELGVSSLSLDTGETLKVEDKIKASIANGRISLARNAMLDGAESSEERNYITDLFKESLIIPVESSGVNDIEDIKDYLINKGLPFDDKFNIHYQTLNKYCRDRLAEGKPIPEAITVFQYQETKLQ